MRILIAATLVACLFTTNLFAGETMGALAPGKPAGVKQAQDTGDHTILWVTLGGVALAGIIAMSNNGGKGSTPGAAAAAAVTTTSSASVATTTST